MRWFSILLALIVAGIVYMFVMQRDTLLQIAGGSGAEPESAEMAEQAAPEADEPDGSVSVVVLPSTAQVIDSAVLVRGRTEAARQVEVRAETSGQIVSDPLRKGTMVEAGQLLCGIDPGTRDASLAEAQARLAEARAGLPLSQARLAEAEARLTEAEINDRAASKLIEGGYASETRVASTRAAVSSAQAGIESARSGLESATSGVQAAAAAVAAAEKEIDRLSIGAPFSGLLETDTAELGALMQPGSLCATVIQLDPMKLVGFVPETLVERVAVGSPAGAELISGSRVTGQVTFLSRSADPITRTFRVEIEVPNPDFRIRDGQTADIGIAAAGETAHLIPASSLTLNDEGTLGVRLAVRDEGTGQPVARFEAVEFLRDTTEGVFVAGLDTNIDLIVVGQEYVTDGVPLKLTFRDAEVTQ